MPHSREPKSAVVLLDTREHTPEHERAVHLQIADHLALLLGVERVEPSPTQSETAAYYYVPTQTLVDAQRYAALGVHDEHDLFGGMVSHPHMATKAISHPLPADAIFPPGWTDAFAQHASDALLRGYTVFSKADARRAAELLLRDGPVRIKPVLACAGRGQQVIVDGQALEPLLEAMDEQQWGFGAWCLRKTSMPSRPSASARYAWPG